MKKESFDKISSELQSTFRKLRGATLTVSQYEELKDLLRKTQQNVLVPAVMSAKPKPEIIKGSGINSKEMIKRSGLNSVQIAEVKRIVAKVMRKKT